MADLLNIALSGLRAFRSSLNTAGHNIANVNTPGYSRQRVDLAAQQPMYMGGSFLGSGVATVEVSRVYDQFLTGRVRELTATQAQEAALHGLASQIDGMLGDSAAGIAPALADFFSALQDLAADPAAIPARQVVLGNAAALADRFGSLGAQLESLAGIADNQLGSAVDSANHLATQIADLNREILISQGTSGNANDLLDRRDEIVRQLAQYAKVSVSEPGDGTLSVFLGNGQPLVVGTSVQQLSLVRDRFDPQRWQIGLVTSGGTVDVTRQLGGGQIGGIVAFRDQVLEPTRNQLGQLALGVAHTFNAQHGVGQDLDGDLGTAFFAVGGPQVLSRTTNSGNGVIAATIADVGQLTASDYRLQRSGADYVLTRLSDGAAIDLDAAGFPGGPVMIDGLDLSLTSGAIADGDSFLIQPTRQALTSFSVSIERPEDIAAAAPILATAAANNTGNARISAGAVTPPPDANLTVPVIITFNSPPTTFELLDTNVAIPVTLPYSSGDSISHNGWTLAITGNPAAGDSFTVGPNTGGVGDNRNLLALTALQHTKTLAQGTRDYGDVYGSAVTGVGARTAQAQSASAAQEALLNQAVAARDSVAGVNLDEEAANLLRFQQAYQAAAQAIQVAGSLFDSLLAAVRR